MVVRYSKKKVIFGGEELEEDKLEKKTAEQKSALDKEEPREKQTLWVSGPLMTDRSHESWHFPLSIARSSHW